MYSRNNGVGCDKKLLAGTRCNRRAIIGKVEGAWKA
jgi:hypothetical protein